MVEHDTSTTPRVRYVAYGLWVAVVGLLSYGVGQTAVKAVALFA